MIIILDAQEPHAKSLAAFLRQREPEGEKEESE
jgi:hypothetical protein